VKDWGGLAEQAQKDIQAFWAAEAGELEWFKKWDKVLDDSNKPFYKWYVGGEGQHRPQCH
jgi:acetyl-CoA synthetase